MIYKEDAVAIAVVLAVFSQLSEDVNVGLGPCPVFLEGEQVGVIEMTNAASYAFKEDV